MPARSAHTAEPCDEPCMCFLLRSGLPSPHRPAERLIAQLGFGSMSGRGHQRHCCCGGGSRRRPSVLVHPIATLLGSPQSLDPSVG